MDGDIRLQSTLGEGSEFTVRLPLRPAQGERDAQDDAEAVSSGSAMRVLLADDNPVNRVVLRGLLARLGCDVVEAVDGQQAVDRADEESFDAVLLDLHMPKLDGLEAASAMRAAGSRVPIVGLSASVLDTDTELWSVAGAQAFLCKPVSLDDLERVLGEVTA